MDCMCCDEWSSGVAITVSEWTMSDDEKDNDVDIESDDEDVCSSASISGDSNRNSFSQADKRAHHNALERKRRDHIKDSFSSLRDAVPSLHGEKASRAQILKKAAEYIAFMRRKNTTVQGDIDDLKRQNKVLEEQIGKSVPVVRTLEKAKSSGITDLDLNGTSILDNSSHTKIENESVSSLDGIHSICHQTQCNQSQCPNPSQCLLGFTDDECKCCQVCLKAKGETCGPNNKCAKGLRCLFPQQLHSINTNLVNNDQEIGVCGLLDCTGPTKCIHNNQQFMNGDKWKADKCTTCECRDGLSFCHKKECNQTMETKNCNVMAMIEDECCPICQGCISSNGKFYNNTHNWYENDCSHCECTNGQISCKVQMCSPVHCDQPINIEGQCCPVCPIKSTISCNIQCPQGFKRNALGIEICECDHCLNKSYKCKIFCPFGFKKGTDGCPICQCLTLHNLNQTTINDKINDIICTLSNGSVVSNGLFWSDGCRECYCNSGKIMCTQPNCPPIQCSNAIFIAHQCCPICAQHINKDVHQNSGGYPHMKYMRNRVIEGSLSENGIIRLWPYSTDTTHTADANDKQFISIRVSNNANNNLLNYDSLDNTLEDKLLTSSCPPPN
ncbi:unnamed protein product [Medioppia subpectinata]|uniref:Protein max n=1 Tax=Medioppia subpectinata TaxID=1979941 RepID=A0A7R9KC88_9ACAR|nr:unnamed protein product [Medioppia subpectinata]CAG2099993.1 unnamed protein product [Medioppia subpectinata]